MAPHGQRDPWSSRAPATSYRASLWPQQHEKAQLLDPTKYDIALAVAQQLMLANASQHRQCHAASTSALFNLVMSSSAKPVDGSVSDSSVVTCSVSTAQLAQDKIARYLECTGRVPCTSLADGLKTIRREVDVGIFKKLQELNTTGSYDRHHGATINKKLLANLDSALEAALADSGASLVGQWVSLPAAATSGRHWTPKTLSQAASGVTAAELAPVVSPSPPGEDLVGLVPCRPHPLHADLAADRDHGGDTDNKTNSVPASADDILQDLRARMAAVASACAESMAMNAEA